MQKTLPTTSQSSVNQPTTKFTSTDYTNSNTIRQPRPCFTCGEKFFPGHQCKQKTLMALQLQENDASVFQMQKQGIDEGEEEWHDVIEGEVPAVSEKVALSVHAMEGSHGVHTIRIIGQHKNRELLILIDSGSTNSFLGARVAKELKLPIIEGPAIAVTVADDRKISSSSMCPNFRWGMQQHSFVFDFKLLDMWSFDIILGVDWLRTSNSILFDFQQSRITF